MSEEGFLRRWSRLKTAPESAPAAPPASAPAPAPMPAAPVLAEPPVPVEELAPPPTMADALALTPDADFSAFVARNVDAAVRRLALKTLFADPHFHGHDGLDTYMADFNVASPLAPGMLDQLAHSRSVFGKFDAALEELVAAAPAEDDVAAVPSAELDDVPMDGPIDVAMDVAIEVPVGASMPVPTPAPADQDAA